MKRNSIHKFLTLLPFLLVGLIAIPGRGSRVSAEISFEPPQNLRDKLMADDLLNGNFQELVHNDYFMPLGESLPEAHQLSGIIDFPETEMTTSHPQCDWKGCGKRFFPAFSLPVVSQDGYLIPLRRGIILSGNKQQSYWNIVVSPGRVWQESGDNGFSRASFPFILIDNFTSQARNGIATFIYNSSQISYVFIQITQETAPIVGFYTADFFGVIQGLYLPQVFADGDQHILDYQAELAAKLPVRPWSELPYGGFTQSFFNGGLSADKVSTAALFMDGTLYLQPASTRTGPYPYPEEMRHGVFSVSKSLAIGLAMFYTAHKYGDGIFDELIADYVPALSDHPGWQGVTFEHVLCMATGTVAKDEGNLVVPFILARSKEDKIAAIRNLPDAPPEPGEQFNYASTNTFVLSCALNQYVKTREGADADIWLKVREEVLKPMGIEHLPLARTIEKNGALGWPLACSYPNVHEAVRIGRLLHDEGEYMGVQLLNRNKVREALCRTPKTGLDAGWAYGYPQGYLHSFWIVEIQLSLCSLKVPFMSGNGGNFIVILPSGVIAVRFSDNNYYNITHMVAVAEFYRRSCLQRNLRSGNKSTSRTDIVLDSANGVQKSGLLWL